MTSSTAHLSPVTAHPGDHGPDLGNHCSRSLVFVLPLYWEINVSIKEKKVFFRRVVGGGQHVVKLYSVFH